MSQTAMLASAAVIAAGVVGGAIAFRPAAPKEDSRAIEAIAHHDTRLGALEARVTKAERARDAAEREAAEAMQVALDARRDLERLQAQTEEIMTLLGGGAKSLARAADGQGAG